LECPSWGKAFHGHVNFDIERLDRAINLYSLPIIAKNGKNNIFSRDSKSASDCCKYKGLSVLPKGYSIRNGWTSWGYEDRLRGVVRI